MSLRLLAPEKHIYLSHASSSSVSDEERCAKRSDLTPVEGDTGTGDRVLLVQVLAHRAASSAGNGTKGIVIQTHVDPEVDVSGSTCRRP